MTFVEMSSSQRNWLVFGCAVLVTAAPALACLAAAEAADAAIVVVLRASAQAAFLVLLLVFVARPLRQLRATPLTLALLRQRRLLGVAFTGVQATHLGLIALRARLSPDAGFGVAEIVPGGLVYLMIVLMFVTSFDTPAQALGPGRWRALHKIGLYVVFAAFLPTLVPESRGELLGPNGALASLAVAAIGIRIMAQVKRHRPAADAGPETA